MITKLKALPDVNKKYRSSRAPRASAAERHAGPTSEDFNAAFGLGHDDGIAPKDLAAVALAAILELNERLEALEGRA